MPPRTVASMTCYNSVVLGSPHGPFYSTIFLRMMVGNRFGLQCLVILEDQLTGMTLTKHSKSLIQNLRQHSPTPQKNYELPPFWCISVLRWRGLRTPLTKVKKMRLKESYANLKNTANKQSRPTSNAHWLTPHLDLWKASTRLNDIRECSA